MERSPQPITRLLIQPGEGTATLVEGIDQATWTIHIVIFRFDRREIEVALKRAARRGVFVHALVAHTSAGQGGDITLRNLELRILADGITVTRTASDLIRYHSKLMVIDSETLFLLAFNYTHLDIDRSRSFRILTRRKDWIEEAERMFAADTMRQQYMPECDSFIVSPINSRRQLMALLASERHQLLIYDDKLSDPEAMRLLANQARAGLDVRVIGIAGKRASGVNTGRLSIRLHAQAIVRDGEQLFLGSQSLRTLELDARREVGVITEESDVIRSVIETFESDWRKTYDVRGPAHELIEERELDEHADIAVDQPPHSLPPSITVELVKSAVKEAIKDAILDRIEPADTVVPLKEAVREAAKEALRELSQ